MLILCRVSYALILLHVLFLNGSLRTYMNVLVFFERHENFELEFYNFYTLMSAEHSAYDELNFNIDCLYACEMYNCLTSRLFLTFLAILYCMLCARFL